MSYLLVDATDNRVICELRGVQALWALNRLGERVPDRDFRLVGFDESRGSVRSTESTYSVRVGRPPEAPPRGARRLPARPARGSRVEGHDAPDSDGRSA
jgi:hypothetical protein